MPIKPRLRVFLAAAFERAQCVTWQGFSDSEKASWDFQRQVSVRSRTRRRDRVKEGEVNQQGKVA